jgi:hypothetical protein
VKRYSVNAEENPKKEHFGSETRALAFAQKGSL